MKDMMGGLMGNGRRRLLNMHGGSGKDLKGMMGDMMGSMGSGREGMEGMMSTMMGGMGSGKEGMEGMMSTMMGNMMGSGKAMEMEGMDALGSGLMMMMSGLMEPKMEKYKEKVADIDTSAAESAMKASLGDMKSQLDKCSSGGMHPSSLTRCPRVPDWPPPPSC